MRLASASAPRTASLEPVPTLERATTGPATWDYPDIVAGILTDYDPRKSHATSYNQPFRVLEAGGGSDCWLPLPEGAHITTIDISAEQLEMNTYAGEKLLGDLQTFDYGARRFDLIVCWDVLEHLAAPEQALGRLINALSPGGRLLIKGPLPGSLKGYVTWATPHALHVLFYRRILGSSTAGLPGHPPFHAPLAAASDPHCIAARATVAGLTVEALRGYESGQIAALAAKSRLLLGLYRAGEVALRWLTLGRSPSGMTDFYLIARKPA